MIIVLFVDFMELLNFIDASIMVLLYGHKLPFESFGGLLEFVQSVLHGRNWQFMLVSWGKSFSSRIFRELNQNLNA